MFCIAPSAIRAVRYHRLGSDAADLTLEEQHGLVSVIYDIPPRNEPVAPEAIEGFIITSVALLRSVGGAELSPCEFAFRHSKKTGVEQYEAFFQAPVRFDAGQTKLCYRSADLQAECLHANPALAEELEQWMGKYLARYKQESLGARVQSWLLEQLPGGCQTQTQAAEQFHMSSRTLQRKLQRRRV